MNEHVMEALVFFGISSLLLVSIPLIHWLHDRKRVRWDEHGNCIQCGGSGYLDEWVWGDGDRQALERYTCGDCKGLGKRA